MNKPPEKETDFRAVVGDDGVTALINPPNYLRINEMFAFVSIDKEGDEGVIGYVSNGMAMPMVGADMARVDSLRQQAQYMADMNPEMEIKLVKFKVREELEVIKARDIKCKKCGEGPWHQSHRAYFVPGAHLFEE